MTGDLWIMFSIVMFVLDKPIAATIGLVFAAIHVVYELRH